MAIVIGGLVIVLGAIAGLYMFGGHGISERPWRDSDDRDHHGDAADTFDGWRRGTR